MTVVIGRSNIVGKPMAALLLNKNATVTICNSYTEDLGSITSKADIIVSAMGKQKFLTKEFFSKKAIVIDVGITRNNEGTIVGDVDFQDVKDHVLDISPVPGG
jgi:methylenetetrahydrofolate dehydrogenase (NADP+)/methenyltetrahydrofolate cyclohydrolase